MPMTIYKLYADGAGDSVASLDIQIDGIITSMMMTTVPLGVNVLDEGVQAEVSFLSSNTFTTNDARGSLMMLNSCLGAITTGGCNTAMNCAISSLEIPVSAGERIHLHILDIGTVTDRATHCYLYVLDKGTPRTPGRRR